MAEIARSKVTLTGIRPPIWRRLEDLVERRPFFASEEFDLAAASSAAARDSRAAFAEQDER